MPEAAAEMPPRVSPAKPAAGWYVLLLAWLAFAAAYFGFSKATVEPAPDITNGRILEIAGTFGPFVGAGLGLATFLATGLVYLIVRAFAKGARRSAALLLTALGYSFWLWFGYDTVYLEPRYTEVARAIITYTGKPMLYASVLVCGLSVFGFAASLFASLRKERKP
jgi:hypothetical protein